MFKDYKPTKFKLNKWTLFKAKLFGEKTYGKDCNDFNCVETFGVVYKGVMIVYKTKTTQLRSD
jgi:hypothetical protein